MFMCRLYGELDKWRRFYSESCAWLVRVKLEGMKWRIGTGPMVEEDQQIQSTRPGLAGTLNRRNRLPLQRFLKLLRCDRKCPSRERADGGSCRPRRVIK